MHIKSLSLKNYKNLNGDFQLSPDINIIIGNNGIGKTNFLEAIHYLNIGESFRNSHTKDIISWNTSILYTKTKAVIKNDKKEITSEYIVADDIGVIKRKFLINEKSYSRKKFLYKTPTILFLPEDINIISESPDLRRKEIDGFLKLTSYEFFGIESEYKKILKNRNKLLQSIQAGKASRTELNYWNEGLIELGSQIISHRIRILNEFIPNIKILAKQIFNQDLKNLKSKYISRIFVDKLVETMSLKEIQEEFSEKIKYSLHKEISAGLTLYGPQRDDIRFFIDNMDIHTSGSRGQQRLVAIILKFTMWHYYFEKFGLKPILLLDDIMSELDPTHRKNLEKSIQNLKTQVVFTSTNENDFTEDLLDSAFQLCI